eukprot:scaffold1770_cov64-Cyclotella_meneghiniana.AAC.3
MSSNQDNSSTNAGAPSVASEPGGLFGYIQSRKKIQQQQQSNTNHSQASNRLQYHKFAQMAASNYPPVD